MNYNILRTEELSTGTIHHVRYEDGSEQALYLPRRTAEIRGATRSNLREAVAYRDAASSGKDLPGSEMIVYDPFQDK